MTEAVDDDVLDRAAERGIRLAMRRMLIQLYIVIILLRLHLLYVSTVSRLRSADIAMMPVEAGVALPHSNTPTHTRVALLGTSQQCRKVMKTLCVEWARLAGVGTVCVG